MLGLGSHGPARAFVANSKLILAVAERVPSERAIAIVLEVQDSDVAALQLLCVHVPSVVERTHAKAGPSGLGVFVHM